MRYLLLWSVVLLVDLSAGQNSTFEEESSWEECACKRGPCLCVVYYLCGADGYIKTSGSHIVDERFGAKVTKCPFGQLCCMLREDEETSSRFPYPDKPIPSSTSGPPVKPQPGQPSTAVCGLRGTSFGLDETWSRISDDGESTVFAEFPWMIAVLHRDKSKPTPFVCGASLIHHNVVMTAAHCVRRWTAQDLVVRAGEWNTTNDDEPVPHQDRFVKEILMHPAFDKGSLFNDVALLVVEQPFEDAINVGVVCLPEIGATFNSQRCLATGWGRDFFGKLGQLQTTLRKVDLPIIEPALCQERLRNTRLGIYFRLDKSFICAGGEPDKDTCEGDGGGPLMCQSQVDPERYIQVGIVSWGIGCKDSQAPAVYTNVALVRPWVDGQLWSLGFNDIMIQP